MDIVSGTAAGGVGILVAKELFSTIRAYLSVRKNGNESPVQVTVEPPSLSSTNGKRICDYHIELNNTVIRMEGKIDTIVNKLSRITL